ncbi:hypothetical protein [Ferdinandcohnia sp. SAFN-114]|uniref:hypothetical protein n=1 Tax=Ferdinandcohnia sp. SAFN-114 TaxID=3387275 RepID=UPI003F7D89D5
MDKALIEEITKLVLKKMGMMEKQMEYSIPLTDDEITEWNMLHFTKGSGSKKKNGERQYDVALTEKEIDEWANIANLTSNFGGSISNRGSNNNTSKVKFTNYCK